jgi:hypothetical protein
MKNIERVMEIREELFGIANEYAVNGSGDIAILLHQACNYVLYAKDQLTENQKVRGGG